MIVKNITHFLNMASFHFIIKSDITLLSISSVIVTVYIYKRHYQNIFTYTWHLHIHSIDLANGKSNKKNKNKRQEKKRKKNSKVVLYFHLYFKFQATFLRLYIYIYIYIFKRHNKNIFSYILYLINIVYLVNGKSTNKNKRKIKENKTTTKKQ